MRFRSPQLPVFVALLATAAPTQVSAQKEFRTDLKDFRAQSVDVKLASIMASPDVHPQLVLIFSNKTDRALWLGARFTLPPPNSGCEVIRPLLPAGKETSFFCALDTLLADVDYPIVITVFADSVRKDTVESSPTSMRFGRKDVSSFGDWLEAKRLPKTYENIVMRESFGIVGGLFGQLTLDNGTTIVKPDGIEYATKKRTVSIAVAQVRRVSVRRFRGKDDIWLVVDYDDAGSGKILAFQPYAFKGQGNAVLDGLYSSLEALAERRERK